LGGGVLVGWGVGLFLLEPYGRIIILHIAILIGGFIAMTLGSNVFVLLLLIVGKTLLDLSLHLAQRATGSLAPGEHPPVLPDVITNGTAASLPTPPTTAQSHPPVRSSSGD
jgi:hypothetical protein